MTSHTCSFQGSSHTRARTHTRRRSWTVEHQAVVSRWDAVRSERGGKKSNLGPPVISSLIFHMVLQMLFSFFFSFFFFEKVVLFVQMETGHFSSEICRLVFGGPNSIGPSFAASCMSQSNRALITQTQLKASNLCVCSETQLCAQAQA